MKKSLLAASVAIALCGVSPSFAQGTITINNGGDPIVVPLTSFSYNTTTNKLVVSTSAVLSQGGGGGGPLPGGDDNENPPGGGNDDPPVGGGDGGDNGNDTGSCDVAGVTCRYAVSSWPSDTQGQSIAIPRGGIVSSRFVAGPAGRAGSIDFEARVQKPYPATNIWISTSPGGPALPGVGRFNYCLKENVSFIYGIAWAQSSTPVAGKCTLSPGGTYYLNIQHSSASTGETGAYRYIK